MNQNRMKMRNTILTICIAAIAVSCTGQKPVTVTVQNDSSLPRKAETVEILFSDLTALDGRLTEENAVVLDSAGRQVPVQVYAERTGQEKLIFQADVPAGKTCRYTVVSGVREKYDTLVYSRHVPERADDYAYENDLIAGRIYGPALEFPRTLGQDIWVKSTDRLIIDEWFAKNDYHHNYGEGMDCYKVDATLGGGACAPYIGEKIITGDNWATQERICNGPIRTKAVFTCDEFELDRKMCSVTREISLDAGSRFVKISTWFNCNVDRLPVVLGAVQHDVIARTDGDRYIAFTEKASDTSDPERDGDISVGLVVDAAEQDVTAGTMDGHAVLKAVAIPGKRFDVWTGSGWSQGGIVSAEQWASAVKDFAFAQAHPLKVTVGR